jgi:small multidrug resistance family-3 protein
MVMFVRAMALFALSAVAEIGGSWLVWQGVREQRGLLWIAGGVLSLALYGFVATLQSNMSFGRVLAAYGGVFIVGSLLWGVVFDGFRPNRWVVIGAAICLVGVAVIVLAPDQPDQGMTHTDTPTIRQDIVSPR